MGERGGDRVDGLGAGPSALAARRSTAQSPALRPASSRQVRRPTQTGSGRSRLDCDPQTVRKWRNRFLAHHLDGLRQVPIRPAAPDHDARIEQVIVRTLESVPPDAPPWS